MKEIHPGLFVTEGEPKNPFMKDWTPETHDSYIGIMRSEVEKIKAERDRYKAALVHIRDVCQFTGISFETQSYKVTEIAREALNPKSETKKESHG